MKNKRKYTALPLIVNLIISTLILTGYVLCAVFEIGDKKLLGIIFICSIVVVQIGAWLLYLFFSINLHSPSEPSSDIPMGNMTTMLVSKFDIPVIVLDEKEKIVWYNTKFANLVGTKSALYGRKFSDYTQASVADIDKSREKGELVLAFDKFFSIKNYTVSQDETKFIVSVWEDLTELYNANLYIENEESVVCYIVIDNIEELSKFVQEKYRSATAKVEELLKSWSDSVDGILREYERDKFVFVFSQKHLKGFVDSGFDILDKVRNIRETDITQPITISIGVSSDGISLSEKEKNALLALDTALQRGGDQAVIRNNGENTIFGGMIKTAQKNNKILARVFAEQLISKISCASNVIIMAHARPDFDAFASCVGISRLCYFCGVKCNIVTDLISGDVTKCIKFLSDLPEYSVEDIFINEDTALKLIEEDTLAVVCDVNALSQVQAPKILEKTKEIVVIDHHRKVMANPIEANMPYIQPSSSSASELVCEVLQHCIAQGDIPKQVATLLLTGIMLDTKQFTRNTGSRTFGAALYLRGEGADPALAQEFFNTTIDELKREAEFESSAIVYKGNMIIARNEDGLGDIHDRVAAAKAADKLLSIDGIEASFVVCTMDDTVHISARSTGTINVQLILEKLGGGGHFDAAATQIKGIKEADAHAKLRLAIDEYLLETKDK